MEFKREQPIAGASARLKTNEKYSIDLQMYLETPTDQIFIEEFQELAVERLKFFRILETVSAQNHKDIPYKEQVLEEIVKQNCKTFLPIVKGNADEETRRKDYLSHFILRLAYCRSEEYRRWFLAREVDFFRLKFQNLDHARDDLNLFMKRNNLNYEPISDKEKMSLSKDLINSTNRNIIFDTVHFYKVPFTAVLDLVRGKKVFLEKGFAYVPYQDLVSVLSATFRSQLSYCLSICAANLPFIESDERLARILKGLHTSYTGNDYGVKISKNQVPLTALDALSKKSFPPCMRAMYDTFQKSHHLRYGGRQQLGLFLKGIGVSLEDSMRFWREGFTKNGSLDSDKFEKMYSYNIRHNYGKEGKRADYTPYSCLKIINSSVGPGDNHGCPFRHWDLNNVHSRLISYGISVRDAQDILNLTTRGHCQLACTKYFEITHRVQNTAGVNHPNQYFEESQKVVRGPLGNPVTADDGSEWGNDSGLNNIDLSGIENEAMVTDN